MEKINLASTITQLLKRNYVSRDEENVWTFSVQYKKCCFNQTGVWNMFCV